MSVVRWKCADSANLADEHPDCGICSRIRYGVSLWCGLVHSARWFSARAGVPIDVDGHRVVDRSTGAGDGRRPHECALAGANVERRTLLEESHQLWKMIVVETEMGPSSEIALIPEQSSARARIRTIHLHRHLCPNVSCLNKCDWLQRRETRTLRVAGRDDASPVPLHCAQLLQAHWVISCSSPRLSDWTERASYGRPNLLRRLR